MASVIIHLAGRKVPGLGHLAPDTSLRPRSFITIEGVYQWWLEIDPIALGAITVRIHAVVVALQDLTNLARFN